MNVAASNLLDVVVVTVACKTKTISQIFGSSLLDFVVVTVASKTIIHISHIFWS